MSVETIPFLEPSLPPLFTFRPVPAACDPVAEAAAIAATGGDETGLLLLSTRVDRLDCALVFNPERPVAEALKAVAVAGVALNDALGSIIPPQIAVTFGWPDRIMLNHALVGGFRMAFPEGYAEDAVPDWSVLGLTIDIQSDPIAAGAAVGTRTSLKHEDIVDVGPVLMIESFTRHLLAWINRWETQGFDMIRHAWIGRADGFEQPIEFTLPGGAIKGRLIDIDDAGGIKVTRRGKHKSAPLTWMLAGASWSLD